MKVAIIVADFNSHITQKLLEGACNGLREKTIEFDVFHVPGAFELPYFSQKIIDTKEYSGVITLGCVIQGETDHYRTVCDGVTYGIQKVSIENRVPVMFGVLMCSTIELALARCDETPSNKGYECAISMETLLR